jgi:hypothetical protein
MLCISEAAHGLLVAAHACAFLCCLNIGTKFRFRHCLWEAPEVARHIAKQQQIVTELVRLGRDTTQARTLLAALRATRIEHEHQRDMLVDEIVKAELRSLRNLLPKAAGRSE